jgi:patatin-like phospholipase/acyl hydrolase
VEPTNSRFQVLSLSGGGYRGVYTAAVLAAIENHSKHPVGSFFEIIAGTSIGGIIGLAAAFEVEMAKVLQVFKDAGPTIFPPRPAGNFLQSCRNLVSDFRRPLYSHEPLRKVIEDLFGKKAKLGDAKHPLLIPAVNLTQGTPQVFKTPHHENYIRDWQFDVVDVALATSAAPTFFPPVRLANSLYADGGLVANSPDLVAVHEATHFLKIPIDKIWLVSIGTTTSKYSVPDLTENTYGVRFWIADHEHRLPNILISAQQQFAQQITEHILGDRYLRIDTVPSHEQAPHLGLDVVTPTATATLCGLGEKAGTDALGKKYMQDILSHTGGNILLTKEGRNG